MVPLLLLPSPTDALSLTLWALDDGPFSADGSSPLSRDELERAQRFVFERDRDRFTSGRVGLRHLLGTHLGEHPRSLHFDYGEHGRPTLRGQSELDFNLSHTGHVALLAILDRRVLRGRVGVDVESRRDRLGAVPSRTHLLELSRVCFSVIERDALERAAAPEDVFYRTWTRKEAVIKALGDGIAYGLQRFDVSGGPDEHGLRFDDPLEDPATWSVLDLESQFPEWAGDVAAAVAIRLDPVSPHSTIG